MASTKIAYDANGNVIGKVLPDGSVIDGSGKIIGKVGTNGAIVDANGNTIGSIITPEATTEKPDWYKSPSALPEIGLSPEEEKMTEKYRRSLGIALTPDGEYLGDIMEDGSVVNKEGKVVGHRMPDGLVIDDEGALIGIEEAASPSATAKQDMFIPAGTFGRGGAYGTGTGPSGNLGPGGGFGPGERYDPQRAMALDAAQQERRSNMQVGKISSNISADEFDGMQKNWDAEGISKAISSWRVDLSEMIFADKPIPAVIARSIDSNNPTPVTAFVERNIYAEEGRKIIIPAGSRIMGTLGSLTGTTETTSQSAKVQITWERLIRPDGSLFVFSGVTGDAQGRGGALGYLDQQLFKKYTLPIMTTALTSYTSYIMADDDDSDSGSLAETPKQQAANDARQNFLDQMNQVFEQILSDKTNIRPLTYVPAGTRIIVYPNVDLWMRTRERNPKVDPGKRKSNILINSAEVATEREKNRRDAPVGGNVVYQSQGPNMEIQSRSPALLNEADTQKNNQTTSNPPLISSTSTGATPPPPPSFATSSTPGAATTGGNTQNTDSSVPQLF